MKEHFVNETVNNSHITNFVGILRKLSETSFHKNDRMSCDGHVSLEVYITAQNIFEKILENFPKLLGKIL